MAEPRKPIPAFADEAEERAFWESADSTEYVDWSRADNVRLSNLRPSTTAISLRLPISLLEDIRIAANKRDVPYQSLIKVWLSEKAASDRGPRAHAPAVGGFAEEAPKPPRRRS